MIGFARVFGLVSVLLSTLCFSQSGQWSFIAARVNNDVITQLDVQKAAREMQQSEQIALEALIDQKLLIQEFYKKKGQIASIHMDAQMDAIVQDNFNGNRDAFVDALKSSGQTCLGLKQEMKDAIIVSIMREQVQKLQSVSPQKVRDYYEQHKDDFRVPARYLIQQSGFKAESTLIIDEQPVLKINRLIALTTAHVPFVNIKKELDEFVQQPVEYAETELDKKLLECLNTLKVGEETGYMLINGLYVTTKLDRKISSTTLALAEVQSKIEKLLRKKMQDKALRDYLQGLRKQSAIHYENVSKSR